MTKNIIELGKNENVSSQNVNKELFLLAEGPSPLSTIKIALIKSYQS
jgi:hypothetical protein